MKKAPRLAALNVLATATALSVVGCNTVAPTSIGAGRSVYNDIINGTEDEQLLNIIVRERYDDTYGMLAVSSVTANIKVSANVGVNAGVGPDEDYAGNLVPFSGGVAYEENPTISYTPLGGEAFVERMLSPVTIPEAVLLGRMAKGHRDVFINVLVKRVNGLVNPSHQPEAESGERFLQFAELWAQAREDRILELLRDRDGRYIAEFRPTNTDQEAVCAKILDLLAIKSRATMAERLSVPLVEPEDGTQGDHIIVETNSVLDIIRAAGQGMAIPSEHLSAGIVTTVNSHQGSELLRVHSAAKAPGNTAVAIQYRGWWYYVDDMDPQSKQAFNQLRTLVGMRLRGDVSEQTAPVLTVPLK